ncbi:MAG: SUMF1/EgtB/PvdO family nonheme iron enzyme [Gammaproteobacteria bacterium]|nr:SUMF1/EgtB/PvdO family nonheme iron enzyme [Gammaproteobacteria bacterium]
MAMGDRSISGHNRVIRGGSWINNGRNARSAYRNRNEPANRNNTLGFRLALAPAHRVIGIGVVDQIVIQSCGERSCITTSKHPGRHCVSHGVGDTVNARWLAASMQFSNV